MPRMRYPGGARLGLRVVPGVRMGPVRMTAPASVAPWATLDQRLRGTTFVSLPVKSMLNTPQQTGMDFWSINPYVGCEFGCTYCYARFAHQYVAERAESRGAPPREAAWTDDAFEHEIFVKQGAREVVARTLNPARLGGKSVVIGTATDPYQPAERTFRLTRGILETLVQFHGVDVGIITKSPLVTRDIDLLRRIQAQGSLTINVSLISVDAALVRRLEPRTPMPILRLRALEQLVKAGLHAGLIVAPVVPGVTDDVPHLAELLGRAKDAGACFAYAAPLRLYAGVRRRFLPLIAEHFPALLPRYERAFDAKGIVKPAYAAALSRRMNLLRKKIGLIGRDEDLKANCRTAWPEPSQQQELALGAGVRAADGPPDSTAAAGRRPGPRWHA